MKRSELGLPLGAWVAGWWCVLWIRNKLPLSNMPSSTRYNGSTGFGRYSPLGGAEEGAQEGHRICRLGYCRVAQSIGLVEGIPNLVSELNGVEYLTQRTSTDILVACIQLRKRGG
jgi:hypothetical protein